MMSIVINYPETINMPICRGRDLCDYCCSELTPEVWGFDLLRCKIPSEDIKIGFSNTARINIPNTVMMYFKSKDQSEECIHYNNSCNTYSLKPLSCDTYPFYLIRKGMEFKLKSRDLSNCAELKEVSLKDFVHKYSPNKLLAFKLCKEFYFKNYKMIKDDIGEKVLDADKRVNKEKELALRNGFFDKIMNLLDADFEIKNNKALIYF